MTTYQEHITNVCLAYSDYAAIELHEAEQIISEILALIDDREAVENKLIRIGFAKSNERTVYNDLVYSCRSFGWSTSDRFLPLMLRLGTGLFWLGKPWGVFDYQQWDLFELKEYNNNRDPWFDCACDTMKEAVEYGDKLAEDCHDCTRDGQIFEEDLYPTLWMTTEDNSFPLEMHYNRSFYEHYHGDYAEHFRQSDYI